MRESRTSGSVRGALSNERPYRDSRQPAQPIISPLVGRRVDGRCRLEAGVPMGPWPMNERLVFILFCIISAAMLGWGLVSGEMLSKFGPYRKDEKPVLYWLSASVLGLFVIASAAAAIKPPQGSLTTHRRRNECPLGGTRFVGAAKQLRGNRRQRSISSDGAGASSTSSRPASGDVRPCRR
jgi:hypothetical protein